MSDNWEDKVKKNKNIPLIILLSILLIISIIFVCNNFEIFTYKEKSTSITKKKERKIKKTPAKIKIKKDKKPVKNKKKSKKKEIPSYKKETPIIDSPNIVPSNKDAVSILKDNSKSLLSVELPIVKCAIADKENLNIKLSLLIYFKGEKLRKEILIKRDNLKIMVQRVLKQKKHSEIIMDVLRIELIKEMNFLLEQGQIENIEFLDFQPVKIQ